jgi:hypothetical protein
MLYIINRVGRQKMFGPGSGGWSGYSSDSSGSAGGSGFGGFPGSGHGVRRVIRESLDSLKYTGEVNMMEASIDSLKLTGILKAQRSSIENAKITGTCFAAESSFNHSFSLTGPLDVFRTSFSCPINITTPSAKLTESSVKGNIEFKKLEDGKISVLTLRNSSIEGNVIFEGGNGRIDADAVSHITGSVVGLAEAHAASATVFAGGGGAAAGSSASSSDVPGGPKQ